MVSVFDVAAYILKKRGPMTTWKLQKLVYYSQAWSLVWDDDALFPEEIEAWANGPVARALYDIHQGQYRLSDLRKGDPGVLDQDQQETVDAVIAYYGNRPPIWLSDLTHMEKPWQQARKGIPEAERGHSVISKESMAEYYSSIPR